MHGVAFKQPRFTRNTPQSYTVSVKHTNTNTGDTRRKYASQSTSTHEPTGAAARLLILILGFFRIQVVHPLLFAFSISFRLAFAVVGFGVRISSGSSREFGFRGGLLGFLLLRNASNEPRDARQDGQETRMQWR